jgi:hypothetical protein
MEVPAMRHPPLLLFPAATHFSALLYWPLLLSAPLAAPLAAQNALQHYDGTDEFTSRGAGAVAAKTLLQRLPMDQACGRTAIVDLVHVIQDQAAPTPEVYAIEVRANDPAAPGTPDMTPAGLLGVVGPLPIAFPGAGVSALLVTVAVPVAVPPFAAGTPAGDLYIALSFPPAPAWPADGISIHISAAAGGPGEQMNALAVGYSGAVGIAGLGWDSPPGGPAVVAGANRAWNLRARFVDDTLQPFAVNPAVFTGAPAGLNPNFGYAGIFPDILRGDSIGWRVLATGGLGDLAALLVGMPLGGPPMVVPIPGVGGLLCLAPGPALQNLGFVLYGPAPPGEPPGTVAASWGPYFAPPAVVGLTLFAQVGSFKAGGLIQLSTSCKTQL